MSPPEIGNAESEVNTDAQERLERNERARDMQSLWGSVGGRYCIIPVGDG
jgi:hypothetical protein